MADHVEVVLAASDVGGINLGNNDRVLRERVEEDGTVTHEVNKTLPDINLREKAALAPIAIAALVMGVAPLVWLNAIDPSVQAVLAKVPQLILISKAVGQ